MFTVIFSLHQLLTLGQKRASHLKGNALTSLQECPVCPPLSPGFLGFPPRELQRMIGTKADKHFPIPFSLYFSKQLIFGTYNAAKKI